MARATENQERKNEIMRDLSKDLEWLENAQCKKDLSDEFLISRGSTTQKAYENQAPEFEYGITFVESTIAKEWLLRAISAERKKLV